MLCFLLPAVPCLLIFGSLEAAVRVSQLKTLNILQLGPPSLQYYCAIMLHSCIVLPPVSHSSNHQYHCCQLTDNRAVFRIFIALLRLSFDSPSYYSLMGSIKSR